MAYTSLMKIGEMARQAKVSVDTVRFYEQRGLLPQAPRSHSGYRQYSPDDAKRLRFIVQAKELGFTLNQITVLLVLPGEQDASCAEVSAMAAGHLEDIEQKIHDLERMRSALIPLVNACPGKGPLKACPILDSLEDDA